MGECLCDIDTGTACAEHGPYTVAELLEAAQAEAQRLRDEWDRLLALSEERDAKREAALSTAIALLRRAILYVDCGFGKDDYETWKAIAEFLDTFPPDDAA